MKSIFIAILFIISNILVCNAQQHKYDFIYRDIDSLIPKDIDSIIRNTKPTEKFRNASGLLYSLGLSGSESFKISAKIDTLLLTKYLSEANCGKYFDTLLCYDFSHEIVNLLGGVGYYGYISGKEYDMDKTLDSLLLLAREYVIIDSINAVADSIEHDYIPKDLDDAIENMKVIVPAEYLKNFLAKDEDSAVGDEHLNMGMGLRNKWHLWAASRLQRSISAMGIDIPDLISSFILHVAHRKLNNKLGNIDDLLAKYREYQKSNMK